MSDTEELCISSVATVRNNSMTFTNTSVRRTVDNNDNLHLRHCNDSGPSTLSGHYVFSCANFDELEEVQFIIGGYSNNSINGWWSSTVRIILHSCSTGMHVAIYVLYIYIIICNTLTP